MPGTRPAMVRGSRLRGARAGGASLRLVEASGSGMALSGGHLGRGDGQFPLCARGGLPARHHGASPARRR
eukprot:6500081-Alexandrium_andersonii.AAC.1